MFVVRYGDDSSQPAISITNSTYRAIQEAPE